MSELAKRIRAKFPGAYDDLDDAALEKAVLAKHPEYADLAQPEEPPSVADRLLEDNAALPPMIRGAQALLRTAKAHPVQAGATAAGIAATPLSGGMSLLPALATTGAAGAVGAGAGQLLAGETPDPATMATEGLLSAGGEGIARGAMAVARPIAKLIYKAALRPSMGLQREFGDVAATGLREGANVSERGANAVSGRLRALSGQADTMIADAEAAGAPRIPTSEVTPEFTPVLEQAERQLDLGRPDPRGDVWERVMAFNRRHPSGINLTRAQPLKGEAQDLASRAYRAADRGGPMTDLAAEGDKAMARGLRGAIEARVPGVAKVNAESQDLIGLMRALEDASRRNVPGVGSVRTLLGDFMPAASSRGAIALDRLGRSNVTSPAFRSALLAMLGQE